jgi:hypothetical protein
MFNFIKILTKNKVAIKMCKMKRENEHGSVDLKYNKNLLINVEFLNENSVQRILTCYRLTKKLCFISSDLVNNLKTGENLSKISIEVFISKLFNFKFKIRYHFFTLNDSNCDFKCKSKIYLNNNISANICLKKQLVCDNAADCIYSDDDENACK